MRSWTQRAAAPGEMPPPPLAEALIREAQAALEGSDEQPRRLKLAGGAVAYMEPILPRPTLLVAEDLENSGELGHHQQLDAAPGEVKQLHFSAGFLDACEAHHQRT